MLCMWQDVRLQTLNIHQFWWCFYRGLTAYVTCTDARSQNQKMAAFYFLKDKNMQILMWICFFVISKRNCAALFLIIGKLAAAGFY